VGKATKVRQREADAQAAAFQASFSELSRKAKQPLPALPILNEFTEFLTEAVRRPEDFVLKTRSANRGKHVLEMARHLFGRFRVPRVLEQCWSAYAQDVTTESAAAARWRAQQGRPAPTRAKNPNLTRHDFRRWYVAAATGASVHKTCAQGHLTKKETHFFLACPHPLDLAQAFVYALARGQGAGEGVALRLARSKLSERDLEGFWGDVVRFFAQPGHTPESVAAVGDLVDFFEARRAEQRDFRVYGCGNTLAALQRRAEEWHRSLARAKIIGETRWDGCGLPDHRLTRRVEGKNVEWVFRQITDARTLAAEGTAMRHCVLGYKARCVQGACSIWSLATCDAVGALTRKLTIELSNDGRIVQKRGLANRAPRAEENHVIDAWARTFGLTSTAGW